MSRCTKWDGYWTDGKPKAVLAEHDGQFADILQPALRKLAIFEEAEELGVLFSMNNREEALIMKLAELSILRHIVVEENARLREELAALKEANNL